jgi:hypothetical protein
VKIRKSCPDRHSPSRPQPAGRDEHAARARENGLVGSLRRWISTWVFLGSVIVAVTAVSLILISNSLVGINANLGTPDGALTDMAGNTTTLPGQIRELNEALMEIDAAMADVLIDTTEISDYFTDIIASLRAIDDNICRPTAVYTLPAARQC